MTFLLAVCMAVSLLAVPAGAANTAAVTFSDLGDKSTAVAVESLRLLGVLDGYGDGTFRPGTVLTRAQFCKMAGLRHERAARAGTLPDRHGIFRCEAILLGGAVYQACPKWAKTSSPATQTGNSTPTAR